jgi:PAS domain S-box-containing protein
MNSLIKKLITSRYEYLVLDKNLIILEASSGSRGFADCPSQVRHKNDARLAFPELVGLEATLLEVIASQIETFELKGITRSEIPESPLYIDLYISGYFDTEAGESRLIIVFEDVTEKMVLQQTLVQRTNEAALLLSSLTASRNYIDQIITSMADALLVTTASGIIKKTNKFAQDLFGYSQEELDGNSISTLIKDELFVHKVNALSSLKAEQSLKDVEVICQTKTGEKIIVAFSCSAIQTEVEGLENFVYIGRDISDRKRAEAEMINALERERELRELKSCFVSMASHEFRTPLTTIVSSTELLEIYGQKWTEDKKQKHYQRIEAAVNRMTSLLDDVLLFSKVEAGKLEFNPKPLVLKNFCSDLVEELQLGIGVNHKLTFVFSGLDKNACLDEKLLLHILGNLLSNAIKYSPQNTTILFGCYCNEEEVIFEVKDEGIGIPIEDQGQLFESFHRAKNVGNIPGTGLGLAIVRNSVNLHGGRIIVESEPGVGTTFKVILPLDS